MKRPGARRGCVGVSLNGCGPRVTGEGRSLWDTEFSHPARQERTQVSQAYLIQPSTLDESLSNLTCSLRGAHAVSVPCRGELGRELHDQVSLAFLRLNELLNELGHLGCPGRPPFATPLPPYIRHAAPELAIRDDLFWSLQGRRSEPPSVRR